MQLVPLWDDLPALSWKEKVCLLTYHITKMEQAEGPLEHFFENGNYVRELRFPAGTIMTGREHLLGHEMQLIEGSVIVVAPDGRFHFDAFASMRTKAGFHAVVYALTDVVSRTIHPNPEDCRDIAVLEKKWFGEAQEIIQRGTEIHQMLLQQGFTCLPQSP